MTSSVNMSFCKCINFKSQEAKEAPRESDRRKRRQEDEEEEEKEKQTQIWQKEEGRKFGGV